MHGNEQAVRYRKAFYTSCGSICEKESSFGSKGNKRMGLFDFLKKKNVQTLEEDNQAVISKPITPIKPLQADEGVEIEVEGPAPLEELLKAAIPSKQDLYPHEIMMLEYATHFKTSNNSFQNFWYYQYSVTEPQAVMDSLYEREFIEVGDLRSSLDKLKLTEIKEELKQLDQKVTGKKNELIDRLMETADIESLNEKYSERCVCCVKCLQWI